MKVVLINACNNGSTGKIMRSIAINAEKKGWTQYTSVAASRTNCRFKVKNQIIIGNILSRNMHIILSKLTGFNGCFSVIDTYIFLKKLDRISPDIIHLHNLHDSYINLPMLFGYIKKRDIKVIWTLHDCWGFTGKCTYFDYVKCVKWLRGCHDCPQIAQYPTSISDNSKKMYALKHRWFLGINDMVVVTPSKWLKGLVEKSFLGEYNIKVIPNGIDLNVFNASGQCIEALKDNSQQHILLGVASTWEYRKGLDIFLELDHMLYPEYKVVLVGTDGNTITEKNNIKFVKKTENAETLASYYRSADYFIVPTREDNLPTVIMEAIACGTPVISFDTGGCNELITDNTGVITSEKNAASIINILQRIKNKEIVLDSIDCALQGLNFSENDRFNEYIKLYNELVEETYG